eukprot:6392179-Pyramimonas_sp.AAC.1
MSLGAVVEGYRLLMVANLLTVVPSSGIFASYWRFARVARQISTVVRIPAIYIRIKYEELEKERFAAEQAE